MRTRKNRHRRRDASRRRRRNINIQGARDTGPGEAAGAGRTQEREQSVVTLISLRLELVSLRLPRGFTAGEMTGNSAARQTEGSSEEARARPRRTWAASDHSSGIYYRPEMVLLAALLLKAVVLERLCHESGQLQM